MAPSVGGMASHTVTWPLELVFWISTPLELGLWAASFLLLRAPSSWGGMTNLHALVGPLKFGPEGQEVDTITASTPSFLGTRFAQVELHRKIDVCTQLH